MTGLRSIGTMVCGAGGKVPGRARDGDVVVNGLLHSLSGPRCTAVDTGAGDLDKTAVH
ncbi:hypothetical protein Q669_27830 [Labrenzia sp. C1B10]|nr:hypothetical protein Q669_27830 [Labrenzia sp. C1B10]ERS03527.1 hypothetical protein Q675_31135 [Labrenzia sp. C1B70]